MYISIILFLFSCGPTVIHSDQLDIGNEWSYNNALVSTYEAQDTTKKYDLALRLKHSNEFDYQNVYLNVGTVFPNGDKTENPLSLELSNKIGNWLGQCSGNECEITFSFQDNFRFRSLGMHQFEISQFSREEKLEGISEIELILFEARETK